MRKAWVGCWNVRSMRVGIVPWVLFPSLFKERFWHGDAPVNAEFGVGSQPSPASHNPAALTFSFWKRSRGSNAESKSANDWPAFPQFISKFRLTDQVTIN